MNPERLLQHFDRISEAPDAIPRLRRFILDLAVRGKLVEQDPNDEPASELLQLVQKGAATHTDPTGWISGAFGSLLEMQYGKGLPAKDRKEQGEVPVFGSNGIVGYTDAALTDQPAIIVGRKGSAGALNLCDGPSWTTDVAYFLVPPDYFDVRFLIFTLKTLDLGALGKGVKPGLSRSDSYQLRLAVPPLAEQHRIVAKVDELMTLCDQLEAAKTEREQSRDQLVAASLHLLNSPADAEEANAPEAFRDHARFVFNHLPRLTARPEYIKQLRQTILNLAVRGKLVPQDPNDEPASELLKRIEAEKTRSVKEGKIRRENLLPPISEKEKSFKLPTGWQWGRFIDYVLDISTGPFGSALHQSDYVLDGVPLVNPSHMINGGIWPDRKVTVSEDTVNRLATYRLSEGDIVMARRGEVGRAAIVSRTEEGWLCGTGSFFLRFQNDVCREYMIVLLRCEPVRKYLAGEAVGITMVNLNHSILKKMPLAIPPLTEQHRIVAKVDELMAICDQLEAQLTATEADNRRLLEAVLHEVLNGCILVT